MALSFPTNPTNGQAVQQGPYKFVYNATTDQWVGTNATGPTGPQGPQGPQGPIGPQGPQGPAGTSTTSIGEGQAWQNVTSSRALGVTYTNTTDHPIQVVASVRCQGAHTTVTVYVDNILVSYNYATDCCGVPQYPFFSLSFIVPANSEYICYGAGMSNWAELR